MDQFVALYCHNKHQFLIMPKPFALDLLSPKFPQPVKTNIKKKLNNKWYIKLKKNRLYIFCHEYITFMDGQYFFKIAEDVLKK